MFDLIGDIHGHAHPLTKLLHKLGYEHKNGSFKHPERKVLFVGDYIDRGPQIPETLRIVRSMVDSGDAIALMGNHEFNALCFHYKNPDGGHLREHSIKNIHQHYETLKQFHNRQSEYEDYVEWFKTLPLFYENDHFRAVHACWDADHIGYLQQNLIDNRLTNSLIHDSSKTENHFFHVIDQTLKGKEMVMPEGLSFYDKDGTKRTDIRIKWWEDPSKSTYQSISVIPMDSLPHSQISKDENSNYYRANEKPVFFGHYWLKGKPDLYRRNICCLDYSVAKGGVLVAYRYSGEKNLSNKNFTF